MFPIAIVFWVPAYTLIEIGTDQRLAAPQPVEAMLRACENWKQNAEF